MENMELVDNFIKMEDIQLRNYIQAQFLQDSWVGGERRGAWWRGWLAIGTGRFDKEERIYLDDTKN